MPRLRRAARTVATNGAPALPAMLVLRPVPESRDGVPRGHKAEAVTRDFSPLEYLRAITRAKLRPTAKLVAYTLLAFADGRTGEVRARQSVLAGYSGLRARAIRTALRELEAAGLLSTSYAKGPGLRTRLARYALKAPASTCRSLTDEAPAPRCRSPRKAAAYNDQRHRHVGAEHSDSGKSDSSSKAPNGARAALAQASPRERIWILGVTILTAAGRSESAARSLLGKWIKDHGEEAVAGALGAAATRADPAAYLAGTLRRRHRQANRAELIPVPGDDEQPARAIA